MLVGASTGHQYHRRRRRGRRSEMAMALLRRSALRQSIFCAASGGDIGMVCGGDVTAHFQFIRRRMRRGGAGLGPDKTAHRPSAGGWCCGRTAAAALLGPEGLLWGVCRRV